jgi:hypothetical protein
MEEEERLQLPSFLMMSRLEMEHRYGCSGCVRSVLDRSTRVVIGAVENGTGVGTCLCSKSLENGSLWL